MNYLNPFVDPAKNALALMSATPDCCGNWSCAIRVGLDLHLTLEKDEPVELVLGLDGKRLPISDAIVMPLETGPKNIADGIVNLLTSVLEVFEASSGDLEVHKHASSAVEKLRKLLLE